MFARSLFLVIVVVGALVSVSGSAMSAADKLLSMYFPDKSAAATVVNYFGLRFDIDENTTSCQTTHDGKLRCRIDAGVELEFEKIAVPSAAALRLLRQNRRASWQKKYSGFNYHGEEVIKVAGKPGLMQRGVYFRFDNINWPVLLRSFDVVKDDKTIINVTTACDVRLWQANIKILENIERSLNMSAAK